MAEMIQNEQELAQILPAEVPEQSLATVTEIAEDGIVLDIGEKHYKCSTGIVFKVGDRVKLIKDSGTYLVAFPVGAPITGLHAATADTATNAENVEVAESAKIAESLKSGSSASQLIQLNIQSSKLYFRIGTSGAWQSQVSGADAADGVRSPVSSSQVIEFSYSSGYLSYRLKGSGSWVRLQNA